MKHDNFKLTTFMIDNKIFEKLTIHAKSSLNESLNIANYYGSDAIYPEHLMFAIFLEKGSLGSNILSDLNIKKESFEKALEPKIKQNKKIIKNLELSVELKKIITRAYLLASNFNYSYIGTEHLIFSIMEIPTPLVKKILNLEKNIQNLNSKGKKISEDILNHSFEGKNMLDKSFLSGVFKALNIPEDFPTFSNNTKKNNSTPNLDYFCTNLNVKVKNEDSILVGREMEMERIFNSLGRKSKNNPLLIGDPGIGKTAIIEGLAQRINIQKVPESLLNKKILALDIALVVAGTNFRGEFEQRLKDILQEAAKNKEVILFIDEIHGIVGAGNASGGLDAANILKPLLTQGSIRCIGATTIEEYKKYIEKDSALERRFQPIMLKEPSKADTVKIIKGIKKNYEKFHSVAISNESIEAAVELSSRYIQDRFQPDKAIDLIDETASRIKNKNIASPLNTKLKRVEKNLDDLIKKKHNLIAEERYDEAIALKKKEELWLEEISSLKNQQKKFQKNNVLHINSEDIAQTISITTNIPVSKILAQSSEKSQNILEKLNRSVIGQEEANKKICQAILRAHSGIGDSEKPIGSFLFLGPSGVGKTLCAKTLAQEFFGDVHSSLIKIDMSEFIEKHNVSRLIGAPAGYIGYGEGGKLTEKVRRQPYSLILFDEIEKAHPDVFNILLQLLEEGVLTDAEGRKVNFKNTIIILTSNIGTKEFTQASSIGFYSNEKNKVEKKFENIKQKVLTELKEKIKPEILNRLDEIIVFDALDENDIEKIVVLELKKLSQRLNQAKKIKLNLSKNLIKFIVTKSISTEKGARYIKKNIRDLIENEIADKISLNKIKNGTLAIDIQNKKIVSR